MTTEPSAAGEGLDGFREFEEFELDVNGTTAFGRHGGDGPAVLLLHGFPQTSAMWRDIAPRLAQRHRVVCLDLRGYGRSGTPPSASDHAPYSKRAMAADAVAVMSRFGHERFAVVGHDRGGRVAYRAALDHPDRVSHLAVLDVLPVDIAWGLADDRFALGFWPWSLLAQEPPLPERLLGAAPDAVLDHALSSEWGTPADTFGPQVRAEYAAQLHSAAHVHAICEEYRAGAGIDRDHDRADAASGRGIGAAMLALWSATGPLGAWYGEQGGPVELWKQLAPEVTGSAVDGGHFFPEEHPRETSAALITFLQT